MSDRGTAGKRHWRGAAIAPTLPTMARRGEHGRGRRIAAAIVGGATLLVGITAVRIAAAPAAPAAKPITRVANVIVSPIPAPRPQPPLPRAIPASKAPAPLAIDHVIDTGGPIRYGSFFWDDGAPTDGPLTITVDLKASVLSVFRGGYEVGTTAVIYGADHKETPLGSFPILGKDRHHISNLYHAPMPYMLRLTRDGVSIHASEVAADYATQGCIGVPAGFAKRLFAVAKVGDRVIVTKVGMTRDRSDAPRIVG